MNCDTAAPNETGKSTAYLFEQLDALSEHNKKQTNEIERLEALAATKDVSVSNLMSSYEQACKIDTTNSVSEVPRRASQTILNLKGIFEEQALKQDTLDKQCTEQTAEIEALRKENIKLKERLRKQEEISGELSNIVDNQASENEKLISMVEQQRDKIKILKIDHSVSSGDKKTGKKKKKHRHSGKGPQAELTPYKDEKETANLTMEDETTSKQIPDDATEVIDEAEAEREAETLLQKLREKDSKSAALLDLLGEDTAKKEAMQVAISKQRRRSTVAACNAEKQMNEREEKKKEPDCLQDDVHRLQFSLSMAQKHGASLEKLLKEQKVVASITMETTEQLRNELKDYKFQVEYYESMCKDQANSIESLRTENDALFERLKIDEDVLDLRKKRNSSIVPTKEQDIPQKPDTKTESLPCLVNNMWSMGSGSYSIISNGNTEAQAASKEILTPINSTKSLGPGLPFQPKTEVRSTRVSKKLNLKSKQGRIPTSLQSLAPMTTPQKTDPKIETLPSPVKNMWKIGSGSYSTISKGNKEAQEVLKETFSPLHSTKSLGTGSLVQASTTDDRDVHGRDVEVEGGLQGEPLEMPALLHSIDITDGMRQHTVADGGTIEEASNLEDTKGSQLEKSGVESPNNKLTKHVSFSLPSSNSDDDSSDSEESKRSIDGDHRLPEESKWLIQSVQ